MLLSDRHLLDHLRFGKGNQLGCVAIFLVAVAKLAVLPCKAEI
jgi:hypothetical protein